jgi:hypothetical protein
MSGGPIHICYYSNRCDWSKAFIREIANTPWKTQFHYICVDPSPTRPSLPNWLKKVPTLVLSGDPEPKTDSEVMNWLYEKKMKESEKLRPSGHQGPVPGAGGEPDAWNTIEQGSFSKGFSYSGINVDTSAEGTGGTSMPGAFSFLGGATSMSERAHDSMGGGRAEPANRKSKKEELFDKQMEAYQRDRNAGVPQVAKRS